MQLSSDEVRAAIAVGRIGAISLDTSIFKRNGLRLDRGPLRQLEQFKGSSVAFVLSEIVRREVLAHLVEKADSARNDFEAAVGELQRSSWRLDDGDADEMLSKIGSRSSDDVSATTVTEFIDTTGAEIARESLSDLTNVLDRYFGGRAPFSSPRKKSEFPDAVALLSLSQWAQDRSTLILVVSADKDWQAYCEESSELVAIDDLPAALAAFQSPEDLETAERILARFLKGGYPDVVAAIESAVRAQEGNVEFLVSADSQFHCEEEGAEATFENVSLLEGGSPQDAELVRVLGGELTIHVGVAVEAETIAHFSFAKWDSIDKEYIGMGTGSVDGRAEFSADVYATLRFGADGALEVRRIEVEPMAISLDYWELEPDWMNDPNEFE